jgi:hypothetical protein
VAAEYLAKTAGAPPAPEPEPEPVASPAPPATGAATDNDAWGVATATVEDGPGCLRVRSGVGLDAEIVDCLPAGTVTWLVDGAPHYADGYTWVDARIPGYKNGWIAAEFTIIEIP